MIVQLYKRIAELESVVSELLELIKVLREELARMRNVERTP
jgi:hypothetical protein